MTHKVINYQHAAIGKEEKMNKDKKLKYILYMFFLIIFYTIVGLNNISFVKVQTILIMVIAGLVMIFSKIVYNDIFIKCIRYFYIMMTYIVIFSAVSSFVSIPAAVVAVVYVPVLVCIILMSKNLILLAKNYYKNSRHNVDK